MQLVCTSLQGNNKDKLTYIIHDYVSEYFENINALWAIKCNIY